MISYAFFHGDYGNIFNESDATEVQWQKTHLDYKWKTYIEGTHTYWLNYTKGNFNKFFERFIGAYSPKKIRESERGSYYQKAITKKRRDRKHQYKANKRDKKGITPANYFIKMAFFNKIIPGHPRAIKANWMYKYQFIHGKYDNLIDDKKWTTEVHSKVHKWLNKVNA